MGFFKRNINGILGTIIFHLAIVIVAMAFSLKKAVIHEETYMLIDTEYLEEVKQDDKEVTEESEMTDAEIEQYINDLRNVGGNFSQNYSQAELQAMSQQELQEMYERELLMEKYGDNYEEMMNTTYEDYLDPERNENTSNENNSSNQTSNDSYAGPALVFVELENPERGKAYIDVPVFTCRHGGTVVIKISIDTDGRVKNANVQSVSSSGDGSCISNAAKSAALQSRFTTLAGGKTEYGTITYQFIQQ